MKHLDLFSGIGGFALATEMVWENVEHVFCDIEPFAQAILKKHWPNAPIYGDIRTLTANPRCEHGESRSCKEHCEESSERTSSASKIERYRNADLLTGGFPCQPFSQAGRRLGTADDRHLWPEMLRVIREFHPRWIIGENVGGFVTWSDGLVLEQVHTDLEGEGYEVQAFIIPAVSLNAPHRRDRVWIVAHSASERSRGKERNFREEECGQERDEILGTKGADRRDASDTESGRRSIRVGEHERAPSGEIDTSCDTDKIGNAPDTNGTRQQRNGQGRLDSQRQRGLRSGERGIEGGDWSLNWTEVAARLCTLDDGLPNGLARPRGWRNAALKGAGNAIVPQVAAEIMRAIKLCE